VSDEVVVYVTKKGRIALRAKASGPPGEAQLRAREAFKRFAAEAKGQKRQESGPPPAAVRVAEGMRNSVFGGTKRRLPKWKLLLLRFLLCSGHSNEEAMIIIDSLDE